jgi:replicative DNA helicase
VKDQHERFDLRPSEGRVPPNDLDAEAACISAVFMDRTVLDRILPIMQPEHFYSDANRHIYEAQIGLHSVGKPIDTVTVKTWLSDRDQLQRVGGVQYLVQVVDAVPAVANAETYARTVREKWRLRQLIATCQRVAAEGYFGIDDAQAFIDQAEQEIFNIARTPEASEVQPVKAVIREAFTQLTEAYERGTRIVGTPTGFTRLDQITGGLHGGDLLVLAARPGLGKTSLALDIVCNVARQPIPAPEDGEEDRRDELDRIGRSAAVFSLEMPREQIGTRMLCSSARVNLSKLRTGQLTKEDWNKLTRAASRIAALPLWIDDTSSISMLGLRAKVRRIQAQAAAGECPPLGIVVIDYLQLMSGNPKASNREQQVSELSRGMKLLAKDLRVPVICLSQLNRACETRGKDKRPQLSDLRESGAVEQDADTVIFIYRDEHYNRDNPEVEGLAELIIAKQRNGPTGTIKVRFTESCTRFDNLAGDEEVPPDSPYKDDQ